MTNDIDYQLYPCFEGNNLKEFEKYLSLGANVNERIRNKQYSIFELACKTPGRKDFIRACMNYSAAYNKKNASTEKHPIHLAAQSLDPENLNELLKKEDLIVDARFEDRTALFLLFSMLKLENINQTIECIKLLLQKGANINATNEASIAPLIFLVNLNNEKENTLDQGKSIEKHLVFFLNNYQVKVHFRNNQLRDAIKRHYPSMKIPEYEKKCRSLEDLLDKLNTCGNDEGTFLKAYEEYRKVAANANEAEFEQVHKELLSKAVEHGYLNIAMKLMEEMKNKNLWVYEEPKHPDNETFHSSLLEKCCNRGYVDMLSWLLTSVPEKALNVEPLLTLVVQAMRDKTGSEKSRFFNCLQHLLSDKRIEINKIRDNASCTALYFAAKHKEKDALQELLRNGAYLGAKKVKDQPIHRIDPVVLKDHLDSCVAGSSSDMEDDSFKVEIDLNNFIPRSAPDMNNTAFLTQMAELPDTKRLLLHPVVSSVIWLKWHKLLKILIVNLFISFSFCFVLTAFLVHRSTEGNRVLFVLTLAGLVYLIVRESFQIWVYKWGYLRCLTNITELSLIIASGYSLYYDDFIAVIAILLAATEFMLLLGSFHYFSFSTHMIMLETVLKNFLKCLILFSSILAGFACSFYVMFRERKQLYDNYTTWQTNNETNDAGQSFRRFQELPLALVKTAVMFIGEIDAGNFPFVSSYSLLVFGLFLFVCPLVLFNLINGIAVCDSTSVKLDSELLSITQKLLVINKQEELSQAVFAGGRNITRYATQFFNCVSDDSKETQQQSSEGAIEFISFEPNKNRDGSLTSRASTAADSRRNHQAVVVVDDSPASSHLMNNTAPIEKRIFLGKQQIDQNVVESALNILRLRRNQSCSIEARLSKMEEILQNLQACEKRLPA